MSSKRAQPKRKSWYERNKAWVQAQKRTPEAREAAKLRMDRYRKENKHKIKARNAVASALRRGILVRQPCQDCGALEVHAHHPDYDKPLDVEWYCCFCHFKLHAKLAKQDINDQED